jgi:hypothetical protein
VNYVLKTSDMNLGQDTTRGADNQGHGFQATYDPAGYPWMHQPVYWRGPAASYGLVYSSGSQDFIKAFQYDLSPTNTLPDGTFSQFDVRYSSGPATCTPLDVYGASAPALCAAGCATATSSINTSDYPLGQPNWAAKLSLSANHTTNGILWAYQQRSVATLPTPTCTGLSRTGADVCEYTPGCLWNGSSCQSCASVTSEAVCGVNGQESCLWNTTTSKCDTITGFLVAFDAVTMQELWVEPNTNVGLSRPSPTIAGGKVFRTVYTNRGADPGAGDLIHVYGLP